MYLNEAKRIIGQIEEDFNQLKSVPFVDKMVSLEFMQENVNGLLGHLQDHQENPAEYPIDANYIYESRDEFVNGLFEAYVTIKLYNDIEDFVPSDEN